MRISDWSSDVCSSDLEAEAFEACGFANALLADPELRSEATGTLESRVSIHPAVRGALVKRQRDFANQPGGAVLDGRDIGTVIAPGADVTLLVTASPVMRALRPMHELPKLQLPAPFTPPVPHNRARVAREA